MKDTFLSKYFNRVSGKDRSFMARQFAVLLGSGIQISECANLIKQQTKNKVIANALDNIERDLEAGYSFKESIKKFPNIFPEIFVNVVAAGETSGKLDETLDMMANEFEKDQNFRGRVVGALLYPGFIVGAMVVIGFIMTIYIVPSLESVFAESHVDLPWTTKTIVAITHSIINYWYIYIIAIGAIAFATTKVLGSVDAKRKSSGLVLELPVMGALITDMEMSRFCRTLAMLIRAGVPIIKSLESVSSVIDNYVYKEIIKDVSFNVERGSTISHTLAKYKTFPVTVTQMIAVGEQTGKLEEMLVKMANYYEVETDQAIKNITALLEPIIFVVVGLGVAFLVFSIIVPIYNLSSAIQ